MAIGIFGGTFNPPHLGHLRLAKMFAQQMHLNRVLVIPTFVPPHKTAPDLASCEDRLAMCRALFSEDERFQVSDMEIVRGGKSYTIETLETLKAQNPDEDLFLLVGSDMLESFRTWYRAEDILKLCTLCAASREEKLEIQSDFATLLQDYVPIEVSSTEIREKVRLGEEISCWVGAPVSEYVGEHRLYEDSWTTYRKLLREKLGDYRLRHSFCVADSARQLAEQYGADPDKMYTAGLLHDVMKDTPHEEMFRFMKEAGVAMMAAELFNKKLWHAMAGEAYLRTVLGFSDPEILNSVRYHTTGRGNMTLEEKIIYIADYISADREYNGVDKMRTLAAKSLEQAMMFGLTFTITDLAEKEMIIHPDSINCYNDLCILNHQKGDSL